MRTVILKCEGPKCNSLGKSARQLEMDLVSVSFLAGQDVDREAYARTTTLLPDRPHKVLANHRAECTVCKHIRTWG